MFGEQEINPETFDLPKTVTELREGVVLIKESTKEAPEAIVRKQQTSEHTLRYNQNKTMYDLIPWEWERALAEIFTFGAKKYAPHNWKKSLNTTDHAQVVQDRLASARRHIAAWQSGERDDPESKVHHLAQASWNLLMIFWYDLHEKKTKR